MNRFSLQNVKDAEVNRVLRQIQDSLNSLADNQTRTLEPLPARQTRVSASVNALNARVSIVSESVDALALHTGRSYTHVQGTPSDTWTVAHNLGYNPSVTVVNSLDETVIGDVEFIDSNTLTIAFSGAFSGHAYCS